MRLLATGTFAAEAAGRMEADDGAVTDSKMPELPFWVPSWEEAPENQF